MMEYTDANGKTYPCEVLGPAGPVGLVWVRVPALNDEFNLDFQTGARIVLPDAPRDATNRNVVRELPDPEPEEPKKAPKKASKSKAKG